MWIIDSVIDYTISISKYKPLAGSSYIKLPKGPYIYDVHTEGGGGVLKFVTCLRILLFLNNGSIVHFCGCGGRGIKKLVIFCGRHKWMTPKGLDHPRKGLINIRNTDDNECYKWCLVRYLILADHHPTRITKTDKAFTKRLDFKDIRFPVNIRGIHKIEKKNSISTGVFGYENKEKHPIYVSKNVMKINMLLYY